MDKGMYKVDTMTINEILNKPKELFFNSYLLGYIQSVGLNNISIEDLNAMINHFGTGIINYGDFDFYYKFALENDREKSNNKTNKIMIIWTFIVGIATIIQLILAIIEFIK